MGNPALFPLIDETDAHDLIIVQVNPVVRAELPRSALEITNRLNEITFNASLIREIGSILLLKELIDEERIGRVRYTAMRLHQISADDELLRLRISTKFNAEWDFPIPARRRIRSRESLACVPLAHAGAPIDPARARHHARRRHRR